MARELEDLSIRELQAMAALCLVQYCRAHRIRHPAIEELVEHLLRMLISNHLPNWEREGACLDLNGRGDPMPRTLEPMLLRDMVNQFDLLAHSVVEVGIVNVYGQTDDQPLRFLEQCLSILEEANVEPPDLEDLFNAENGHPENDRWGRPISSAEYERVRARYLSIWQDFG